MEEGKIGIFRKLLLKWNRASNSRQMPWKGIRDPYRIWISEIIMQQTRVEQGWDYYLRMTGAFPTVEAMAAANDDAVYKLWEGLGYYSRCRNMLATAREIAHERQGRFPGSREELLGLKGIGPYTAAAIASFAFDEPCAVVDGNVKRVLSRVFGLAFPPESREGKPLFQQLAEKCLARRHPSEYNQAIMDFGATVCKPRNPDCPECPMRKICTAFQTDRVQELPSKAAAPAKKSRQLLMLKVMDKKGGALVQKRDSKGIWPGLYTYPLVEVENIETWELSGIEKLLWEEYRLKGKGEKLTSTRKHVLTHRILLCRLAVFRVNRRGRAPEGFEWAAPEELIHLAMPRVVHLLEADVLKEG